MRRRSWGDKPPQGQQAGKIDPVGTVWYGYGCADDQPTSRDQVAGIAMGLAFAHQLVDDATVRARAKKMVEDLLDYLIIHSWQITVPPRDTHGQHYWANWDKQLALLRIGATVSPGKFLERYRRFSPAAALAWLPGWFATLEPLHQYYKFNLGHATFAPALYLEDNPGVRAGLEYAQGVLSTAVRHHKNAWFTALDILARKPGDRAGAADEPAGSNPQISKGQEIKSLLIDWLQRRKPGLVGPNGLPLNKVAQPDLQLALWPRDVARYTTLDLKPHCFARHPLDPQARLGRGMDFMWQRHPFGSGVAAATCDDPPKPTEADIRRRGEPGVHARREGPGVDFLLPYWLSAYLGILPAPSDA